MILALKFLLLEVLSLQERRCVKEISDFYFRFPSRRFSFAFPRLHGAAQNRGQRQTLQPIVRLEFAIDSELGLAIPRVGFRQSVLKYFVKRFHLRDEVSDERYEI